MAFSPQSSNSISGNGLKIVLGANGIGFPLNIWKTAFPPPISSLAPPKSDEGHLFKDAAHWLLISNILLSHAHLLKLLALIFLGITGNKQKNMNRIDGYDFHKCLAKSALISKSKNICKVAKRFRTSAHPAKEKGESMKQCFMKWKREIIRKLWCLLLHNYRKTEGWNQMHSWWAKTVHK